MFLIAPLYCFSDIAAFMSGDGPDTDLLMNCIDELEELKENEANFAFSSCLPKSPGLSSCDDGYNSGIESDGKLSYIFPFTPTK